MSSGRFQVLQVSDDNELHSELQRLNPVEVLVSEDLPTMAWLQNWGGIRSQPPWLFDFESANRLLNQQLGTRDLSGFGCDHLPIAICAAGCLLQYAKDTQRGALPHIRSISAENRAGAISSWMLISLAARTTPYSRYWIIQPPQWLAVCCDAG